MSVDLELSSESDWTRERALEFARGWTPDPRVVEVQPGFDAPFQLAGLAGYSDAAMRMVCRELGAPYCITEALLDERVAARDSKKRRVELELPESLARGEVDRPIAGQLMGTSPDLMAEAAEELVREGYDAVDINFACPVKKVAKARRGGHFLAAPDEAIQIVRAVVAAVDGRVPVTAKIRRGSDDSADAARDFERLFDGIYESGCAWATVHARTVDQKYRGPSSWSFLRELTSKYRDRVIFGSGDIDAAPAIFAMLSETGVHGVSVARGAIADPFVFRDARSLLAGELPSPPSHRDVARTLERHLELALFVHGEHMAPRILRKFAPAYARHHEDRERVRKAFVGAKTAGEWLAVTRASFAA